MPDPVTDPVNDPVTDPVTDSLNDPVNDPVNDLVNDLGGTVTRAGVAPDMLFWNDQYSEVCGDVEGSRPSADCAPDPGRRR